MPDLFLETGRQRGVNHPLAQRGIQAGVRVSVQVRFHTAGNVIRLTHSVTITSDRVQSLGKESKQRLLKGRLCLSRKELALRGSHPALPIEAAWQKLRAS